MYEIRVDTNLLRFRWNETAQKQVRFAASQAINATAALVKKAERANLSAVLDKPTPFTVNAIGLMKSSKKTLKATVFMKDRTAWYLEPYELGGPNKLNSSVLLKPEGQRVNQYGNLPRNTTTKLLARKDTFVGTPKGWKTNERGIWKRRPYLKVKRRRLTKKQALLTGRTNAKQRPPELLIEFTGAHEATQRLNYQKLAKRVVSKNFKREFTRAMKHAIANAKP